ncbi:hypothetical protein DOY81_009654, partial [Sarcophaga bullata]
AEKLHNATEDKAKRILRSEIRYARHGRHSGDMVFRLNVFYGYFNQPASQPLRFDRCTTSQHLRVVVRLINWSRHEKHSKKLSFVIKCS